MNRHLLFLTVAMSCFTVSALAQPGPGGPRHGKGRGGGERHAEDHEVFHFLLSNHEKISRSVQELPNGVSTLTESDDPKVASKIKNHVRWMEHRIEQNIPIRRRDPLFAEIFEHTQKIKMQREETPKGVRVIETSDDPYVAKLIKAHAKVVSGFVSRGYREARINHEVPERAIGKFEHSTPAIAKYGGVVRLDQAAHQPRSGSKIVVDVTAGGEPDQLNPAIEKAARFVNIYHGAGRAPAPAEIVVILHGGATMSVLNSDQYEEEFGTHGNPNLDCLHALHEAGVKIYVCGQALVSSGNVPMDVVPLAEVSVSGVTAIVNLQADGYAYVPLK